MYLLTDVSYKALYINFAGVTQEASIYFPMHLLLLVAKEQKERSKAKEEGIDLLYTYRTEHCMDMENLKCLKNYFREEQSQLLSSISCNIMLRRLLHVVIHTGALPISTQYRGGGLGLLLHLLLFLTKQGETVP